MMKRTLQITAAVLICSLAIPALARHRDFDHIGNFNFRVEIDGIDAGVVALKSVNPSANVTCPKEGDDVVKLIFKAKPTPKQLAGLKNTSTYTVSNGTDSVTLTGVSFHEYAPKKKTLVVEFGGCS